MVELGPEALPAHQVSVHRASPVSGVVVYGVESLARTCAAGEPEVRQDCAAKCNNRTSLVWFFQAAGLGFLGTFGRRTCSSAVKDIAFCVAFPFFLIAKLRKHTSSACLEDLNEPE